MQSAIHSNRNGDSQNISTLPWLFKEKQRNDAKDVIEKNKFPTRFSSNIKNILTKKGELGGVKTHDWNMFIKVIILVYIYFIHW